MIPVLISISLSSALIISFDYLEATVHHPLASQNCPTPLHPLVPGPNLPRWPPRAQSRGCIRKSLFFPCFWTVFPPRCCSSFPSVLSHPPQGLFCLLLMEKVHHHLTTPRNASQQTISASQNLPVPWDFFPLKALSHLAPIPKCFCSTSTCFFSPQNEAEAMLQLLGWGLP